MSSLVVYLEHASHCVFKGMGGGTCGGLVNEVYVP